MNSPCRAGGPDGPGALQGGVVVPVFRTHRARQRKVLDGVVMVSEASRGESKPEVRVVLGRAVGDDRREALPGPSEGAGTVLRSGQGLADRPRVRLRSLGMLEKRGGGGRVAGGKQLQAPDIPVVDGTGRGHCLLV